MFVKTMIVGDVKISDGLHIFEISNIHSSGPL